MNREEAKAILQCYTTAGQEITDPLVAEALAFAQSDRELRAWWKSECALDSAIARKLNQTTVPADLADRILGSFRDRREDRKHFRRIYLAMAAALLLLGIIAGLLVLRGTSEPETEFSAFRREMAMFLREFPRLDIETEKLPEVTQWLAEKPRLRNVEIPAGLQRFPSIGCREIQWREKKAALICFMVDGEVIHLIVVPNSAFSSPGPAGILEIQRAAGLTTAAWQQGELLYLAVTKGTKQFVQTHLRS